VPIVKGMNLSFNTTEPIGVIEIKQNPIWARVRKTTRDTQAVEPLS